MLVFAILAVFIAGLMVGRTPEYMGKKIDAKEVKMAMLAILILPFSILGFTALATVLPAGLAGSRELRPTWIQRDPLCLYVGDGQQRQRLCGPHRPTRPFYNSTLGLAMFIGRFLMIAPIMAIAGSLARKRSCRLRRHLPDRRCSLRRPAHRCDPDHRWSHLFPPLSRSARSSNIWR